MARSHAPRRSAVLAECIAFAIALIAIGLGAHEFGGTFGSTDQRVSCGSVWGLSTTGDLNAASCGNDLSARLTLVAVLLGLAGIVALTTPVLARRSTESSRRRLWIAAALATPVVLSLLMIQVGRHLMWSVSGG